MSESTVSEDNEPISLHLAMRRVLKKRGLFYFLKATLFGSEGFRVLLSNFLLSYSVRAGISLLLRILGLLRAKPESIFSLKVLLEESNFKIREEAVRTGLFVGLFTSIYRVAFDTLGKVTFLKRDINDRLEEKEFLPWHSAVAGSIAGISLLVMDSSWHKSLALYMATRAAQSVYNCNKSRGKFHFWGSNWNHGDSLLFAISSAQILYSYVMRPEVLPRSYYNFILKQGPYTDIQLRYVRASIRDNEIDVEKFMNYLIAESRGSTEIIRKVLPFVFLTNKKLLEDKNLDLTNTTSILKGLTPRKVISLIPLQGLHSYTQNTWLHTFNCFTKVAKFIFPVYFSLALVPATILRFGKFSRAPTKVIFKSFLSAVQSTTFLSLFCALYQVVVNIQRLTIERVFCQKIESVSTEQELSSIKVSDFKFIYWIAGFLASGSLLLEKKNRRSELALYALPRAVDALFLLMLDRRMMFYFKYAEICLFCASMGSIMYFYENYPESLSPLLKSVMTTFLENTFTLQKNSDLELLKRSGQSFEGSIMAPL